MGKMSDISYQLDTAIADCWYGKTIEPCEEDEGGGAFGCIFVEELSVQQLDQLKTALEDTPITVRITTRKSDFLITFSMR